MIHHVLHFGSAAARYEPLLRTFATSWKRLTGSPITILTDLTTQIPADIPAHLCRVDPAPFTYLVRPGNRGAAFDYKAAICLALIASDLPDTTVIMDSDNVLHADPTPTFAQVEAELRRRALDLALVPDPGQRPIGHPYFDTPIIEESTSCMILAAHQPALAAVFLKLWKASIEPDHFLLEQRTWSLVAHNFGFITPPTLSWSRQWGLPPPKGVCLEHRHGSAKWE
jgi:hypothetical protein